MFNRRRCILGLSFFSLLWLSFAEAYHHHQLQQKDDACAICTVAHQAPTLLNAPHVPHVELFSSAVIARVFTSSRMQFVVPSNGRSPPQP